MNGRLFIVPRQKELEAPAPPQKLADATAAANTIEFDGVNLPSSVSHLGVVVPHAATDGFPMHRHLSMSFVWWLCLAVTGTTATVEEPTLPLPWTVSALAQRLQAIDQELNGLAYPRLMGGIGPIGYRSLTHDTADVPEWIEIDLEGETTVNEVIVVPTLFHLPDSTVIADGFPEAFRVIAINDRTGTETLLAAFTAVDNLLPRKSPLVISCPPVVASRIRLEAIRLSPRAWDNLFDLQLSELLVFCGRENVAFQRPVTCSSSLEFPEAARQANFLVDGILPFIMDAQSGSRSLAYVALLKPDDSPQLTIDLGEPQAIDAVRLHAADVSDNVPQSHPNSFGIPPHIRIEGASTADFSDAVPLKTYKARSELFMGPIMTLPFPETTCRFVKITGLQPSRSTITNRPHFGFAEVECLLEGRNLALGKPAATNLPPNDFSRRNRLPAITDGNNYYGEVLPLRTWLEQLARRHELERDRPLVLSQLTAAYQRQASLIQQLVGLAILLTAGITALIAVERYFRQRAVLQTREQIAADLHDELGANLHAIALCGDLAQANLDKPTKLADLLRRVRVLTDRSAQAAKACVNLLESTELYEGLEKDLQRTASRLLADLDYELSIAGKEHLAALSTKKQIGTALFFKECLANIIRHAQASRVATAVTASPRELVLTVTDNGRGLPAAGSGDPTPPSLIRRARLLGGSAIAFPNQAGGTVVTLRIPVGSRWLWG